MDLETRIEHLERSARRWRFGALTLGLALAAMVTMGFDTKGVTDLIRTHRLVITDAAGRSLITLDTARGGSITLGHARGPIVRIGTDAGDGYLEIRNASAQQAISLRAMSYGGTCSILANGQARVRLHGLNDAITIFDDAKPVWMVP